MKPKRQEDSSCVFAYYFCRGTCHRRDTAGKEKAPKLLRRRPGRSFVKAVRTIRQENRQGRGKLPPCMPQSECGTGHTGYRAFLDPSPDGSQDTGGAFRSRVQRSGVRHRSIGAGHICPMWQRTDLAQVKRDRHTDRPRKARSTAGRTLPLRQSRAQTLRSSSAPQFGISGEPTRKRSCPIWARMRPSWRPSRQTRMCGTSPTPWWTGSCTTVRTAS